MAGRRIKRYHVTADPAGIAPDVEAAAYAMLPKLLPEPDGTPPRPSSYCTGAATTAPTSTRTAGCGTTSCTSAARRRASRSWAARTGTRALHHRPPWIGCVWELPPILHERDAWVRHMLAPDAPDLDAYLADSLPEGTTGDRS